MTDAKAQSFCAGWRTVKNIDSRGMDKSFSEIGWSCFEKASPVTVNVVGLGDVATLIKVFRNCYSNVKQRSSTAWKS